MEIILGSAISLLIQYLKTKFATSEYVTLAILLVVSLFAAGLYVYLVSAGYWNTVGTIIATAGLFYTFIIARFTK